MIRRKKELFSRSLSWSLCEDVRICLRRSWALYTSSGRDAYHTGFVQVSVPDNPSSTRAGPSKSELHANVLVGYRRCQQLVEVHALWTLMWPDLRPLISEFERVCWAHRFDCTPRGRRTAPCEIRKMMIETCGARCRWWDVCACAIDSSSGLSLLRVHLISCDLRYPQDTTGLLWDEHKTLYYVSLSQLLTHRVDYSSGMLRSFLSSMIATCTSSGQHIDARWLSRP